MGRHGENIRKRQDGRWEGRYGIYNEEKKKKIYFSVYAKTYNEVKQKLFKCKSEHLTLDLEVSDEFIPQEYCDGENFSFYAENWLKKIELECKLSTYEKYRLIYRKYIENIADNLPLTDISIEQIKSIIPTSSSESLQKSILCVLNQIIQYISEQCQYTIPRIDEIKIEKNKKTIQTLTLSEQTRLLAALNENMDYNKMGIFLCLNTGLRLGEYCALRWSDIDFNNQILSVNRTVQRLYASGYKTKTILQEMPPKSFCSIRQIPLSNSLCQILHDFDDQRKSSEQYVSGKQAAMEPRTIQYRFKKILQQANIPERKFHILRHTFATNCIEQGMDIKCLSEILGHSDVKITLNRYVHPSMQMKRQYMNTVSDFYGQICGQEKNMTI